MQDIKQTAGEIPEGVGKSLVQDIKQQEENWEGVLDKILEDCSENVKNGVKTLIKHVYELGKQEMLAMVLKEIEESRTKSYEDIGCTGLSVIDGWCCSKHRDITKALDTLKETLQAKQ